SWLVDYGPAWDTAGPETSRNFARAAALSWSARRRCRRAILMTSPLRRKRLTTVRGQATPARTPARLLLAVCWLSAGVCAAQEPVRAPSSLPLSPSGERGREEGAAPGRAPGTMMPAPPAAVLPSPDGTVVQPVGLDSAASIAGQVMAQPGSGRRP